MVRFTHLLLVDAARKLAGESARAVVALVDTTDPFQPLPAAMIARKLGVSRQLLKAWVDTGKLQPAAYGLDGRPLFRHIDAARVESQTRNDPRSSRRRCPVIAAA